MKHLALVTVLAALAACANQTVLVYEDDGARQCEGGSNSLGQSRAGLIDANVKVLDSMCGVQTGMAYIMMCGGPTPGIFLHEIPTSDLQKAEARGFADAEGLSDMAQQTGFDITPCPDR